MAFLFEEGRGKPCVPVTESLFQSIVGSNSLEWQIKEYRKLLIEMHTAEDAGLKDKAKELKTKAGRIKSQLPGWVFQSREMGAHEWIDSKKKSRGVAAWRHQDWAIVNGLVMCDYDHIDDPREAYQRNITPLFNSWEILFAYITPSGRGLKVVFVAKHDIGDIAANQQAFSKDANLACDEVCFDASRLSFCTAQNDILFLSKDLFEKENVEFIKKYRTHYFRGVKTNDMFGGNSANVHTDGGNATSKDGDSGTVQSSVATTDPLDQQDVLDFSNYRYDGLEIPKIIEGLMGGQPVPEGKRHDTLFNLAKKLRYVCERSAPKVEFFLSKLQWVIDLESEDHNTKKTIEDAMAKPYSSYLPKDLQKVLRELNPNHDENVIENEVTKPYKDFGHRIAEFFDVFPCLREVCFGMEPGAYAAALYTAAAFFGTLMTRCWYQFWFQPTVRRRLNYCIFIIGDPGCGKSFMSPLFDLICEPIILQDKIGNDAINKYKEEKLENSTKSDKKKGEGVKPPKNIIRIHGARTANGVFIEDMVRAVDIVDGEPMNLHLLSFDTELDSITTANKGGQWIDKTNMEIYAFHNERDSQQYKNVESISGPFNVYWNYVYTGTPLALNKKVNERNFGTGLFGRLGCIPYAADYFETAEERVRTKEEDKRDETLRSWGALLDKVQGELPLKPVVHATHEFVKEANLIARLEKNKPEAFLVRRVPYYGINITAPFILMRHWKEWEEKRTFKCDKKDVDFCNLVMEIQLYSQRLFFGKYAEMYFDNSQRERTEKKMTDYSRTQKDILNQLPATFTLEECMKASGYKKESAYAVLSRWKSQGLIKKNAKKDGKFTWTKM